MRSIAMTPVSTGFGSSVDINAMRTGRAPAPPQPAVLRFRCGGVDVRQTEAGWPPLFDHGAVWDLHLVGDEGPALSADGLSVAFVVRFADAGTNRWAWRLLVGPVDQPEDVRPVEIGPGPLLTGVKCRQPRFSPDGARVAFIATDIGDGRREEPGDLLVADVRTRTIVRRVAGNVVGFDWAGPSWCNVLMPTSIQLDDLAGLIVATREYRCPAPDIYVPDDWVGGEKSSGRGSASSPYPPGDTTTWPTVLSGRTHF